MEQGRGGGERKKKINCDKVGRLSRKTRLLIHQNSRRRSKNRDGKAKEYMPLPLSFPPTEGDFKIEGFAGWKDIHTIPWIGRMCFFRALKHVTWIKNILQSCQPQRLDRAGWNPLVRSTWRIRETLNTRNARNRRGKREGTKKRILYLISLLRIVSHAILPENLCLLSRNL